MTDTESFVIILRPAPEYGQPGSDERISENFSYLKKLNQEDKVMMARRFTDVLFDSVMLEVENREKAEEIMRLDPAVSSKVFLAEIYPWRIALGPTI